MKKYRQNWQKFTVFCAAVLLVEGCGEPNVSDNRASSREEEGSENTTISRQAGEKVPGQHMLVCPDVPNLKTKDGSALGLNGSVGLEILMAPTQGLNLEGSRDELIALYKTPDGGDISDDFREQASKENCVIEQDEIVELVGIPSDKNFGSLWGMHNSGQNGGKVDADIDAPEAWDISTGSDSIIVGVVDSGVDYNHKDLAANMWRNPGEIPGNGKDDDKNGLIDDIFGADFANNDGNPMDDNNHGTHCAGTIGAVGDTVGVIGVAPKVKIMALKFLTANGSGSMSAAIRSINYGVAKGAKILSNSWGGGQNSSAVQAAIKNARNAGVLFVVAAGNEKRNNDRRPSYPANYNIDNIISVAATDRRDNLSSFSNYGVRSVHIGAPGSAIYSTVRNNAYASYDGTSMATPHVAGAAALLWGYKQAYNYGKVRESILGSVDKIPSLAGRVSTGGRLNVFNMLKKAE